MQTLASMKNTLQNSDQCCQLPYGLLRSNVLQSSRQQLHSSSCHQLVILRQHRNKSGHRLFSIVGLMAWNSLPSYLMDLMLGFDPAAQH